MLTQRDAAWADDHIDPFSVPRTSITFLINDLHDGERFL
jgi:hypothetical protein